MNTEESSTPRRFSSANTSRLKQERERKNWSQNELAKLIGTNQSTISRWENGDIPNLYFREKLARVFEKTSEELGLTGTAISESEEQLLPPSFIWNVPYRRNPFFTGREEILSFLTASYSQNTREVTTQVQVLSGLAGVGKTQIAIEYCYRSHEHYQAILWTTASTREVFTADLVMLATLLGLPEQQEQEPEIVIRAVKHWLMRHNDWLLIVDNIEDMSMITEFLPTLSTGDILLTARLQAVGPFAKRIEVEKMSQKDAIHFLLRRSKQYSSEISVDLEIQEQAAKIAAQLDGLPLALDQAGAYIEETRCGFAEYLQLYHRRSKELLQRRGMLPTDHPESVTTTWALSFRQVQQINAITADILRLFAFLSPDAIPEEIIAAGANELAPDIRQSLQDPFQVNEALQLLLKYSLLQRNPESKLLSIHRLVQVVIKDSIDKASQYLWIQHITRAINHIFPEVRLETWRQCLRYLPHVLVSANYVEEYNLVLPEAAHLYNKAAAYLTAHAQFPQAEALLKKALAIQQQILEPVHLDIASTFNDLGKLYLRGGNYQEAKPLLLQALAIRQQLLGMEHPETVTSLNNLAELQYAQGEYQQAEQRFLQALHIRQRILKPEHPDLAVTQNNLAELYKTQGKYPLAASYYEQAVAIQEKVLGREHPALAQTMSSLAQLYRIQGEHSQAKGLYEKEILRIQEQVLGQDHPDVAVTLTSLARLLRTQGEYERAKAFFNQALHIQEKKLGQNHPDVAQTLYALGEVYNSLGMYRKAAGVFERTLTIQEPLLGSSHPSVALTLAMLAKSHLELRELSRAEDLSNRALHIREAISGNTHPQIAFIMNNLAQIHHLKGEYQVARPLLAKSYRIYKQSLGPEHPYIAYSLSNIAENHLLAGEYTKAEIYLKKALSLRQRSLGVEHPNTALSLHQLADFYLKVERFVEAERLFQQALAVRERAFGLYHPKVLSTLERYIALLERTNQQSLASELKARTKLIKTKECD